MLLLFFSSKAVMLVVDSKYAQAGFCMTHHAGRVTSDDSLPLECHFQ